MSRAKRHVEADELVKRVKDAAASDEVIQGTKDIGVLLVSFWEKLDKIATAVEELGHSDSNFPLRVKVFDTARPSEGPLREMVVKHASLYWTLKMARRVIGAATECDVSGLEVAFTRPGDDAELDDHDNDERTLRSYGVCTGDVLIVRGKPWEK